MTGAEATILATCVVIMIAMLKLAINSGGDRQSLKDLVETTKSLSLTSQAHESRIQRLEDEGSWQRRNGRVATRREYAERQTEEAERERG